jgi:pimeloyl-ACP methyl ester carboxylesterase
LALAAVAPELVTGVIACCALTDMRWSEGRRMQDTPLTTELWDAPDRDSAIALAEARLGPDGSKMLEAQPDAPLPPADQALLADPTFLAAMAEAIGGMFAHGVIGYVDDRLADGVGWVSFDVGQVGAPTIVLHGSEDSIVNVGQARHTAELVPGARLKIVDGLAHLSIATRIVETLGEL